LPVFWPRLLHNLGALLAIGGFWLMNLGFGGARRLGEGSEAERARTMGKVGALVTMGAVAFELFTGMLLFAAESKPVQSALFSGRPAAILWMVALIMGMALLAIALVELVLLRAGWPLHAAGSVLLLLLGGMFAGREAARQARLAPYFKMSDWPVRFQPSSLVLFLVMFVLALVLVALIGWWLRQAWAARAAGREA
jgi:succinate dehydrogenase/fumarate reductase cytochrome b subunit